MIASRVRKARAGEALAAKAAGIAASAGAALGVGVVARDREREIDAQLVAAAHDVRLRQVHDGRDTGIVGAMYPAFA